MNPTDYCTWPSLAAGVEKAIDFPFTLLMAKLFSHKAERYVMITPITKPANTVTPYRQSLLFDKTNSPFLSFILCMPITRSCLEKEHDQLFRKKFETFLAHRRIKVGNILNGMIRVFLEQEQKGGFHVV